MSRVRVRVRVRVSTAAATGVADVVIPVDTAAASPFRPGNALLAPGGDLHKSTGAPKRSTGRF